MIGEPGSHGRGALPPLWPRPRVAQPQTLMTPDKVVGGAHQKHPGAQERLPMSQGTGVPGEGSQTGAEGGAIAAQWRRW